MSESKKYQVELFFGYQECEDGIYHSFELADPDDRMAADGMAEKLSGLLDTEPGDDRFNYNSMYVDLPQSIIEKIKKDAIEEYFAARK